MPATTAEASLHALNPFAPGAGREPSELSGREPELEAMDRIIARTKAGYSNQGMILSGLRGVGKTVLLLRMRGMVESQHLPTIKLEATGDAAYEYAVLFDGVTKAAAGIRHADVRDRLIETFKHITSMSVELLGIKASLGLESSGGAASPEAFKLEMVIKALCKELKTINSGLFVFIDEFQAMDPGLTGVLLGVQHSLGQENLPFYIIGAGLPDLPGVLTKARSYAERLFDYREIGKLPHATAAACFQETARKGTRSFADDALERLVEVSQGYPYFIQAYGEAAFDQSDSSVISLNAVRKGEIVATQSLDTGLYASRWQRATAAGREYMEAMAELDGDSCGSSQVADRLGKEVAEVSHARKSLIDLGLIYAPERGRVAFTVPGMAGFIKRAAPAVQSPYVTD